MMMIIIIRATAAMPGINDSAVFAST